MNKALFALATGGFGIGLTEFVIMGILPEVADDLRISIPQASHFISAYAIGVVVGAPILTSIGGKLPAQKVLLMLMLLFTIFNTFSAFADSYYTLLVSRFLAGLPHGAFFGIGAVVASRLAIPGKEAKAIATMFTGLTIANVVGVPFGTYLGHQFSWNVSFMMVGIVGLMAMGSLYFWMPILPQSSQQGFKKDLKVLKRIEPWMVILLTTIGTGGFFAWYSYIAPLITEVAGHPDSMISVAMTLAGVGMVIGNILGAKLAEIFVPIKAVIVVLILMVIALSSLTFVADHQIAVLAMTFIIGLVAFCISTPLQMTMINSTKGSEMLGSSLKQSAFNMGNASGAYLASLPIALGYGYTSADWVGAAMAGSGIFIALGIILVRKRKRASKEAFNHKAIRTKEMVS